MESPLTEEFRLYLFRSISTKWHRVFSKRFALSLPAEIYFETIFNMHGSSRMLRVISKIIQNVTPTILRLQTRPRHSREMFTITRFHVRQACNQTIAM
jgi:hypothetical protein